jgi:hypothetical protein
MADRTFHHDYRKWAVSNICVFLHLDISAAAGPSWMLNGLAQYTLFSSHYVGGLTFLSMLCYLEIPMGV